MDLVDIITRIAIGLPGFLAAIACHEAAHAYVATKFGDETALRQGRLTLNPAAHYDPIGTVIFPLFGAIIGGVMFGWARPVPVNAARFKNVRSGIFWVSFAGPLANVLIAILSAFFLALFVTQIPSSFMFHSEFVQMFRAAILINIVIAIFNLIPFPPLDGAKMISTFMDYEMARKYEELGRYSFVFILVLWFTPFFSYFLRPALYAGNHMMNIFINILA